MPIPKPIKFSNEGLNEWNILHCYRGSIAHGTYIPNKEPSSIDDKDTIAICIPPIEYYFGLKQYGSDGTKEIKQAEWDIVVYELKKFIRLLKNGNPNVLSVLWTNKEYFINLTEEGQMLLSNRHLFIGKHIYKSFVGYAKAQLHRMTHQKFDGYMGEKRKHLVEQYGFDCKNGSHLIRLLRMGIEFLITGQLNVLREQDATELIAIKKGEWSLERIQNEAERLFKLADEAFVKCTLPNNVDDDAINLLCIKILENRKKNKEAKP